MIVHMVINRKRAGVLQQLCVICCKADAQPGPTKRFLPKEQIFYFYLFKVTKQPFAKMFESHLRYMGRNSLHQHGKCSYSSEKSNWMPLAGLHNQHSCRTTLKLLQFYLIYYQINDLTCWNYATTKTIYTQYNESRASNIARHFVEQRSPVVQPSF